VQSSFHLFLDLLFPGASGAGAERGPDRAGTGRSGAARLATSHSWLACWPGRLAGRAAPHQLGDHGSPAARPGLQRRPSASQLSAGFQWAFSGLPSGLSSGLSCGVFQWAFQRAFQRGFRWLSAGFQIAFQMAFQMAFQRAFCGLFSGLSSGLSRELYRQDHNPAVIAFVSLRHPNHSRSYPLTFGQHSIQAELQLSFDLGGRIGGPGFASRSCQLIFLGV